MDHGECSRSAGSQRISDGADGGDRRGSERYRTLCRIARVERRDDTGLWRVRNISDEGLMLAADIPVTVGEAVRLWLSESSMLRGTIRWAVRGRCGVAFDQPIDAAALLQGLAEEQRAEGYRALRLPVEIEAILTLRGRSRPIDLVDISQHGAGFRCDEPLEPGAEADLLLPGLELQRRALVRWSRAARGGLWFTRPLDRADLESIALLRE